VVLSLEQLRELARAVGFPDVATAAAVAMAESGGDSCARGDPHTPSDCSNLGPPSTSLGLWQIHVPAHPEVDASQLFDPLYNAHAAFAISSGGTNWHPWSTYTSGAYQRYLGAPAGPSPSPSPSSGVSPAAAVATVAAGLALGALGARFAPVIRRLAFP